SSLHSEVRPQAVAPVAVRDALLDRVDAIPGPVLAEASWAGDEPDVVTLAIDAGFFEQPFQGEAGQDGRAQAQAFHRTDLSPLACESGADCQEPIGIMRKGAKDGAASPARKPVQSRVGRAAVEVDDAIPQRLRRVRGWEDELHLDPFLLEESE